jgi:hypothetical protein
MTRRYFTEAEVQMLVGKRVKRDEVIGEVKGYEYIADIEEEEEPYSAYSLGRRTSVERMRRFASPPLRP